MKKILLSLAVVSLISFTACKDEAKPTENQETTAQGEEGAQGEEATPAEGGEAAATGVPTFSEPEVQKFVNEYDAFVKEYIDAAKSGDATKLGSLAQKSQEWAGKQTEVAQKLASNPDDLKKYNEYIQKIAQEMQAAMTAK